MIGLVHEVADGLFRNFVAPGQRLQKLVNACKKDAGELKLRMSRDSTHRGSMAIFRMLGVPDGGRVQPCVILLSPTTLGS